MDLIWPESRPSENLKIPFLETPPPCSKPPVPSMDTQKEKKEDNEHPHESASDLVLDLSLPSKHSGGDGESKPELNLINCIDTNLSMNSSESSHGHGDEQRNELERYFEDEVDDDNLGFYILTWLKMKVVKQVASIT